MKIYLNVDALLRMQGIQQFSISASFTPKKECKRINKTIPSREYTKRYHLKLPLFTSLFTAVASSGH